MGMAVMLTTHQFVRCTGGGKTGVSCHNEGLSRLGVRCASCYFLAIGTETNSTFPPRGSWPFHHCERMQRFTPRVLHMGHRHGNPTPLMNKTRMYTWHSLPRHAALGRRGSTATQARILLRTRTPVHAVQAKDGRDNEAERPWVRRRTLHSGADIGINCPCSACFSLNGRRRMCPRPAAS